jgi:hypothetical protein
VVGASALSRPIRSSLQGSECGCHGPLEADIIDLRKIAVQDELVSGLTPQYRSGQHFTGPTEEAEGWSGLVRPAEPVDLFCDCEYAHAIRIVACQGKAQQGKVPRAQQPRVPFG